MLLPLRTESDELSEKIEAFIQQNSANRNNSASKRTPSKERQSYVIIEENAQQSLKRLNWKVLNQLKLMIKPHQKIVDLSCSLLTLLAGIDPNIPTDLLTKTDVQWANLQPYFQHVSSLLQTFTKFKELLRMRKIQLNHYKVSKAYYQRASTLQCDQNKHQQSLLTILTQVLQSVHAYIKESYHPAYLKGKRSRSQLSSQLSIYQVPIETVQLQQQTEEDCQPQSQQNRSSERCRTMLRDGRYGGDSSRSSQRSGGSTSVRKRSKMSRSTLRARVEQAMQQKQSRLEKILNLRVKKPVVQSILLSSIQTDSNVSEKDLYKHEIEKNRQQIKQLQREGLNFKWQIEREVKELQKLEHKSRMMDDIGRYQLIHERKKLDGLVPSPLGSCKSGSKRFSNKENYGSIGSKTQKEENSSSFVNELKRELLNSQRTKEQLTENLLRTLNVSNSQAVIKRPRQDEFDDSL